MFSCPQFMSLCYVLLMRVPNILCQAASRLPKYDFLTTVFLTILFAWDIALTICVRSIGLFEETYWLQFQIEDSTLNL